MKSHVDEIFDAINETDETVCIVRYRTEIGNERGKYAYEFTKKYSIGGKLYYGRIRDVFDRLKEDGTIPPDIEFDEKPENPNHIYIDDEKNKVFVNKKNQDGPKYLRAYGIEGEESYDGEYLYYGRPANEREIRNMKALQKEPVEESPMQSDYGIPVNEQVKIKTLKLDDIRWIILGDDENGEKIY